MESGPNRTCHSRFHLNLPLAGSRKDFRPRPRLFDQRRQVQAKVEKGDEGAEPMQRARRFRPADDVENRLGPVGVVELQRHAGDDQQQKARHHQEMQKPLKRHEAREPFVVHLRLNFRLAEFLRVVQIEVDRAHQPPEGVQAEESERADEQAGHAQKHGVEQRIMLAVQRIGVRIVFGEADGGVGMTLLAGGQNVGFGQMRARDRTAAGCRDSRGSRNRRRLPGRRWDCPAPWPGRGRCPGNTCSDWDGICRTARR